MKKFVVFDEQGFPSSSYPAPPASHVLVDAAAPLRDEAGRWLRPDGSYAVNLAGLAAFGGVDGRQPAFVPGGHWGEGWPFFANLKTDENPFGILRDPRPETTAERRARERAEADATAAAEAARIAALVVSDRQFAQAVAQLGWALSPHDRRVLPAAAIHDELLNRGHDAAFASAEFRRAAIARGVKPWFGWLLFAAVFVWTVAVHPQNEGVSA